jgi:hypothetical protein
MTEPTPLPRRQPQHDPKHSYDDHDIEHEIEHAIRNRVPAPISMPRGFEELGKMSGEAVLAQYEAAAKSVEEMGDVVKNAVKQLSESLIQCDADLKFIAETANAIRDKGLQSQELVQKMSDMSRAIRDTCLEFKRKVDV